MPDLVQHFSVLASGKIMQPAYGLSRQSAVGPELPGKAGFPNPYHGTRRFGGRHDWADTWFHGTKGVPEFGERKNYTDDQQRLRQAPGERQMTSGWPQPNKMLGVHFSPLHEVAHKFVGSVSSQPGALVHARLHFSNPAHFPTEDHLNLAVAQWADRHYPHWHDDKLNQSLGWNYSDAVGTHRNWHEEHLPGGKPNPHGLSDEELAERNWGQEDPSHARYLQRVAGHAQQVLQWHPHLPEILHGFSRHLHDQGHRGITYGNEVEGPYDTDKGRGGQAATRAIQKTENWPWGAPKHISAIAQPEDIETVHVEHVAPWNTEPQPHERTWEDISDQDEPDEMRDRVLAWHRQHGGEMPSSAGRRTAAASDLVDGPFLHGGPNRVEPGGLIHQDAMPRSHGRLKHNFFTTDRNVAEDAADMRNGLGHGWIHTVEPTGQWEVDFGEPDSWKSEYPLRVISVEPGRHNGSTPHPPILREGSLAMPSEYAGDETAPPEGEIHRGISLHGMSVYHPEVDAFIHDESIPAAARAARLMDHLGPRLEKDKWGGGGVGKHWSTSERIAQGFATAYMNDKEHPWHEFFHYPGATRVIFHAAPPKPSHMITSPRTKMQHDILPTSHGEREIPLRNRAPVMLTGISWSRNEKDAPWTRHDFPQPIRVKASGGSADRWITCDQGHEHWGAHGAAGLLIRHRGDDGQQRYLLQKRTSSGLVDDGGTWSLPGGALHRGESPEQGAMRESREEFGPLPRSLKHHHTVLSTDHGNWKYHTVVMDASEHFLPRGGGATEDETAGAAWHTADEIEDMRARGDLHPAFAESWGRVHKTASREDWPEHWMQPPERRIGHPGEYVYRFQPEEFTQQTLEHGIAPRRNAGSLPDDPDKMIYMKSTDRLYHVHPEEKHPGTPEWREQWPAGSFWKVDVSGLPLIEDRTYTNPQTSEKQAWMTTEHIGPERLQVHEPGSEHGVSYDLPDGGKSEWMPSHTAKSRKPIKTKDQVNYRPSSGRERCGNCTMIRLNPPDFESHGCTLVKGLIDPDDVCDEWYPDKKAKEAVIRPGSLPPEHEDAFEEPDTRVHRRKMLDVAENPPPGTRVWRGEVRREDEDPGTVSSTGMHWSVNPDSIITGWAPEGHKHVVWQGIVENAAEQAFPRSHPLWGGRHQSYDHEAEVRFRPGSQVKLEGAYVHEPAEYPGGVAGSPGYLVPRIPERTHPDWKWHPLDRHIKIRHAGHGAADYSDVGIEREAAVSRSRQSVQLIHPHDLMQYVEVYRTDDEGGRKHRYDLAKQMQGGYRPSAHGGMSGDKHSFPPSSPITLVHTDEGSYFEEGNHRVHALNDMGYGKPVPVLVKDFRGITAAIRHTPVDDGPDGHAASSMVAIVPPAEVLDMLETSMKPLTAHQAEPRSQMHLTVLYLGEDQDHPDSHLDKLPELVRQWASTVVPFTVKVQGAGTFANDGKHVLHALADISDGQHLRTSLEDFLRGHGIHFPRDHGFTPHITLAYSPYHVRFLPKIRPMSWPVSEIWYCRGGRWESFLLGRKPAKVS